MNFKSGTVGRFLPGVEHRLEAVPGLASGSRLFVRGPNVMLGYLRADRPGHLEPPVDGWYDTGDIVEIDEDGFVAIKGRAKRFAKVAGEMVPLGAVEDFVGRLWPTGQHAVIAVPDPKRGEQLMLGTTHADATRAALMAAARDGGLPGDLCAARLHPRARTAVAGIRQGRLCTHRPTRGRARARVMTTAQDSAIRRASVVGVCFGSHRVDTPRGQ